jgi:hypothetical protein
MCPFVNNKNFYRKLLKTTKTSLIPSDIIVESVRKHPGWVCRSFSICRMQHREDSSFFVGEQPIPDANKEGSR